MPELPEVQTVLDGFVSTLKHRKISNVECYYPGTVIHSQMWQEAAFPASLGNAFRVGKYMIIKLDNGYCIIIHLRMTGKLVYAEHPKDPHRHERARICLEDGTAFHFIDPRTFGKIVLCSVTELPEYLPKLGLEPFSKDFTARRLSALLQRRGIPIKNALLDQSVIAGLGNIYVCELLFRARIHPHKPANTLSSQELTRIVRHTRELLSEAIVKGGTSISDFRRIDDKTGEFQNFLRVYQKSECPLGHSIKRIKTGGRSTYFCPVCQKSTGCTD